MMIRWLLFITAALMLSTCTKQVDGLDIFDLLEKSDSAIISEIDSLMLSMQIDAAAQKLLHYRNQEISATDQKYVNSKLWRCKLHYAWMFEAEAFPSLDTQLILPIDSFYFEFYRTGTFEDISIIEDRVDTATNFYQKIDYMMQLSTYYFYQDDIENAKAQQINRDIYQLLEPLMHNTAYHLTLYHMMVNISSYSRKNLRSLVLCRKFLDPERATQPLSDVAKARMLNQRILTYTRLENPAYAIKDVKEVKSLLNDKQCTPEYHVFLKNAVYAYLYDYREAQKSIASQKLLELDTLFINTTESCGNDYANYHRVKGQILSVQRDFTASESHWQKALQYYESQVIAQAAVYNTIVWYYSQALEKNQKFDQAKAVYRSKPIAPENSSEKNQLYSFSFIDKARLASISINQWKKTQKENHQAEAIALLNQSYESLLQQTVSLNEASILRIYGDKTDLIESALDFIYDLYQKNPTIQNKQHFYQFASIKKNMLLERDMQLYQSDSLIPKDIRKKEVEIKKEIKSFGAASSRSWPQVQRALDEQDSLEAHILSIYNQADLSLNESQTKESLAEVQHRLSPTQSFLDYYLIDDTLYIILINREGTSIYKREAHMLERIINELYTVQSKNQHIPVVDYQTMAHEVYVQLVDDDILAKLKQEVIISADDVIHQVNFEALVTDVNTHINDYKEVPYLMHNYDITYAFSPRSFITPLLPENLKVAAFSFSDGETILAGSTTHFSELPYAYKEVNSIKTRHQNTIVYSGAKATKGQFIESLQDPSVDYIHLSLHAVSNTANRDDVKLYFRTSEAGIDSLYGYELLGIETAVKKIVLSACESGAGHTLNNEGIFSLNRYFDQIGVSSQASTLWKIDSQASSELTMLSKKEFIEQHPEYGHPYYWASFISY